MKNRTISVTIPLFSLVLLISSCGIFTGEKEILGMDAKKVTNRETVYQHPSWSTDGQEILYYMMTEYGDEIWSISKDGKSKKRIVNDVPLVIDHPVWINENQISYIGYNPTKPFNTNGELHLLHLHTRNDQVILDDLPSISGVSWNPTEQNEIAIGVNVDATIFLYDLETRSRTSIISEGYYPRWSPDGEKIAYFGRDGIYLYNVHTQETRSLYIKSNQGEFLGSLTWSPDSEWIAFRGGPSKEAQGIYVVNTLAPSKPEHILNYSVAQVRWSPQGDKFLFTTIQTPNTNDIYIMDVPSKYRN